MNTLPPQSNGEQLLQELRAKLQTAPYAVVEQVALLFSDRGLTEKNRRRLLRIYAEATLRIVAVEDIAPLTSPIDSLFAPSLQFWQKERVAVLLLYLFFSYRDLLTVQEIAFRAPALFDEVFENNLYRMAHLDAGKQSYAKIEGLVRLVGEFEDDMSSLVNSLTALDALPAFRAAFLKRINSGLARKIAHLFLPDQIIDQRFNSLIAAVDTFRSAEGPVIIEKYHEVASFLDEYAQLASVMGTKYADLYCGGVARQLRKLVDAFFHATHFSKPATLTVTASEKKYPLRSPGASFDVFLDVYNSGPGFAFGVDVEVIAHSDNVLIRKSTSHLGGIEPSKIAVAIPAHAQKAADLTLLELKCSWTNFDGTASNVIEFIEFAAQRGDIDWEKARREDLYSLDAIPTVDRLVGRADILDQLIALTTGPNVESAFIRGQRRVGKTSIAKVLASHLASRFPSDYVVVFLEAGDYIAEDATTTIQFLGRKLCRSIKRSDDRFSDLEVPSFEGALSPIIDFLEDAKALAPKCRMLFILDEFDDLPLDLYRRGLVGDAFFRTIRSISNKEPFGFLLVGSEKMDYVLSGACQRV